MGSECHVSLCFICPQRKPFEAMKIHWTLLISLALFHHSDVVTSIFLQKYKGEIQNYIMTGHEKEWTHCDILSEHGFSYEGVPQTTMVLKEIKMLNLGTAFASSHCLLVTYYVGSMASLSALLEFGWAAIRYVRLALVIEMGSGVTLEKTANTSRLPFLVAAESDQGREQFLCPVVGEVEPRLEDEMCKPSYVSYKSKAIKIALYGIPPWRVQSNGGLLGTGFDGINVRFLKYLSERLNFLPHINVAPSHQSAEEQVCNLNCGVLHLLLTIVDPACIKITNN